MSRPQATTRQREETPVDDVRRIRERLSREAGGDVHRLMEQSRKFLEEHWESLGLKRVSPNKTPRSQRKRQLSGKRRGSRV